MSKLISEDNVQMYNVIGRDIREDLRNANIDVQSKIRQSFYTPKCQKLAEHQIPFPSNARTFYAPGNLPFASDSISRVRRLEQRDEGFSQLNRMNPIVQRQANLQQYDPDKDPRYHMIQDNLASRQKTTMSIMH